VDKSDGLTKEQREKIELSLVKNVMGPDGVMNPELTEKQKQYARDVVGAALEIQTLRKVSGTPQSYYKPESGGGADTSSTKTDDTSAYESWLNTWNGTEAEMNSVLRKDVRDQGLKIVKNAKGETSLVKVIPGGRNKPDTIEEIIKPTKDGTKFRAYFYAPDQLAKLEKQEKIYWPKYRSGQTTQTRTTVTTSKENLRKKYGY
jgi:hypothetical protein